MTPGKVASQAGHAFVGAALESGKERWLDYSRDGMGTKVCVVARNSRLIEEAHEYALEKGIPCFKVIDSGCTDFFGGKPILTALGIGPVKKNEMKMLRKFQLL